MPDYAAKAVAKLFNAKLHIPDGPVYIRYFGNVSLVERQNFVYEGMSHGYNIGVYNYYPNVQNSSYVYFGGGNLLYDLDQAPVWKIRLAPAIQPALCSYPWSTRNAGY